MARVTPQGEGAGDSAGWLDRVERIRKWKRGGERAPHKPLLLLHAIAQLHSDRTSRLAYEYVGPKLRGWLDEFGPQRMTQHPEQPFWRLQNDDGLWLVSSAAPIQSDQPSDGALREANAVGSLAPDFASALLGDPVLMLAVVRLLLVSNWPESLHLSICKNVGLDLDGLETSLAQRRTRELSISERRRDPEFRTKVLRAYEYRCAMCGFDGRLDSTTVGLEAAHIQWWAEDGPDEISNGLSLCAMHHQLFDRGVLGLSADREVMVSAQFVGRDSAAESMVTSLGGQELLPPRDGEDEVAEPHRSWHEKQVFRHPAR
ncbi:MAG: restriction endonuclease [Acidobacteria bacterium]|nr:restriction endonuclease [Acidobacteriota bacterium]